MAFDPIGEPVEEAGPAVAVEPQLNPVQWTQGERAEFLARGFRSLRAEEVPRLSALVRPTDYTHDLDRGTVNYSPKLKNYCFSKVRIPAGSVLHEHNFAQAVPNSPCITVVGGQALTLIGCNLTNCAIDPAWTLVNCNTAQAWIIEVLDENQRPILKRQYITDHPSKITGLEQPPQNVVTTRPF